MDETVRLEELSLKELRMLILTTGQSRFGEEAPAVLARVKETRGKPLHELERVEAEELAKTWLSGDEENGHGVPVETEAQSTPEPEGTERPRSPAALREYLTDYANKNPRESVSDNARGLMCGKISEAFLDNSDQPRHLFLEYVTGEQSSGKLSPAMLNAILQWLVAEHDEDTGEYVLDAVAIKELTATVRQAQLDKGQIDMFVGTPRVGVVEG